MALKALGLEDTIVAISTPLGESGIGIVRMSGKDALRIADEIFVSRDEKTPSRLPTFTTHYGHIVADGVSRSAHRVANKDARRKTRDAR